MVQHPSLLTSHAPLHSGPANVTIGHVQLRDLIICPSERGVVNYVKGYSIVEHNLTDSTSHPRSVVDLSFKANTISSLRIPGTDNVLLAAGGQEAEVNLSLHSPSRKQETSSRPRADLLWQFHKLLAGTINNSVLLTATSLGRSHESSVEPRLGVSNNDCTVKFYDIPVRGENPPRDIYQVGRLRLDVPINHSSVSPDGRALLSVGDSTQVYLHQISGGSQITFSPISTLTVPPPDIAPHMSSSLAASFSTAFSTDGSKFAVASQEGVVVVWDVRSTKPLKILQTDKSSVDGGRSGSGNASGWLSDDPLDWSRGGSRAPGWGVRSVKFGCGSSYGRSGHEVMIFTEHTSFLHVVDADTFDTHDIVRVPSVSPPSRMQQTSAPTRPPMVAHPRRPRSPGVFSRHPRVVLALEDTFRIPTSGERMSLPPGRRSTRRSPGDDPENIMLVPPLGDFEVDYNVRELLSRHGLDSMPPFDASGSTLNSNHDMYIVDYAAHPPRQDGGEDDIGMDELESDCLSSHTPSRSSSPSPSANLPTQTSPPPVSSPSRTLPSLLLAWNRASHAALKDDVSGQFERELDLSGSCFDPTGGFVYVASVEGVYEWAIDGADKRWWSDSAWV